MGTALATNDIIALRAWCTLGNQASVNTFNFIIQSVVGGGVTDQDVVDQLDPTLFKAFYQPFMAPTATYQGLQLYFVKRAGFLPGPVQSTVGVSPGTNGLNSAPRVVASILKYNTGIRGPIGRGRLFLPFVGADFVSADGEPTAGHDVLVNSFASALLTTIAITVGANTANLVWSLLHRIPGPPVTFTSLPIVQALSADKFGGLRKRGDYGRANESPI